MEISRFFIKLFTGSLLLFLINGPSLATEPEYPLHSIIPYDVIDQWDTLHDETDQWDMPYYGEIEHSDIPYGEAGQWVLLGDNLITQTEHTIGRSSLISDLMGRPILSISTRDQTKPYNNQLQTHVARWSDEHMTWIDIAPPLTASAILGIDNQQRIYLCGNGGPSVWRWNGVDWIKLGGPIARESGHYRRHISESCSDIAFDNTNNPLITWTLIRGTRHRSSSTYAARWDEAQQKWLRLGKVEMGSIRAKIDTDILNRPYLATSHTGSRRLNSGTRTNSRFWRWDGNTWIQLGAEFSETVSPFIALNKTKPYIALGAPKQIIRIMRWRQNEWEELPNPGAGYRPQLDFTPIGKPIIAYQFIDEMDNRSIQVKHFANDTWQDLGEPITQNSSWFELIVDTRGRPTIAWTELDPTTNQTQLFVKRFQHSYD